MKRKTIHKEITKSAIETGFDAILNTLGWPIIIAQPIIKGLVLGLFENCYNDCAQRTLSIRETKRLNQVTEVALQTFRTLAEKDGIVAWEVKIDSDYLDYVFEVAEHTTIEAIRQSEVRKVDVLGRYYGKSLYDSNRDWQDMHQVINMISSLTLRQIVLIRLIVEGFKGFDKKLFIKNPSVCVELNRLKDYGIWRTKEVLIESNNSSEIQINRITATDYAIRLFNELMLDCLSDSDVQRAIDSLQLSKEGTMPYSVSIDIDAIQGELI